MLIKIIDRCLSYFAAIAVITTLISARPAFSNPEGTDSIPPQPKVTSTVTLEELKTLCYQDESSGQRKAGALRFNCCRTLTVFAPYEEKKFPLENSSSFVIQAKVKSLKPTDRMQVDRTMPSQVGVCVSYEELRAVATKTEQGGCELIDTIIDAGGEVAYCAQVLKEDGLIARTDKDIAAIKTGDLKPSEAQSFSHIERTGRVLRCPEGIACQVDHDKSKQLERSSDPSPEAPNPMIYGAYVKEEKVDVFSIFGNDYDVIHVLSDPLKNSLFQKLDIKKGDLIAKIKGKRVSSLATLVEACSLLQPTDRPEVSVKRDGNWIRWKKDI